MKAKIRVRPPGPEAARLQSLESRFLSGSNPRVCPLYIKEGHDTTIVDVDGNQYLDFVNGAAVCNVGIGHPEILEMIRKQSESFLYTIFNGYTESTLRLAERLSEITPGSFEKRTFFCLSGSDANETAFKLARWATKRQRFVSFVGSYHGVTMGALSLSGHQSVMNRGQFPLVPGVYYAPYPYCYRCPFRSRNCQECANDCLDYLEKYIFHTYCPPEEVAAVFFEPVQGDGGVLVPPPDFSRRLKEICDKHGILLVDDEVQTGFGRTGRMFAIEHWNVVPDLISVGKPMGSGLPMAACIADSRIMTWGPGTHGLTFSGYTVGAAVANTTLDIIEREKLVSRAEENGAYLLERCEELRERHRLVGDVRGLGLLVGVEIVKNKDTKEPGVDETKEICLRAFQKGLLTYYDGLFSNVFRLMPALTISREDIDEAIAIFDGTLSEVES